MSVDLPLCRRVLLKLSGEALLGESQDRRVSPFNSSMLLNIAQDIRAVRERGVSLCLVVGGGNIYRGGAGAKACGIPRPVSDQMGMMATVINALALQAVLNQHAGPTCLMTAFPMPGVGESYHRHRALDLSNQGHILIFAGGMGSPFFTTDTAAVLRGLEMECDILFKATKFDGVYDQDPALFPAACHLPELSYEDLHSRSLNVIDRTAAILLQDHRLPLAVFSLYQSNPLETILQGKGKYTLVS